MRSIHRSLSQVLAGASKSRLDFIDFYELLMKGGKDGLLLRREIRIESTTARVSLSPSDRHFSPPKGAHP
jgi:hypothetical protein